MDARADELNGLLEKKESRPKIRKEYAAHDFIVFVWRYFFGEPRQRTNKETFSSIAETLVAQGNLDNEKTIEASRKLLEQQRIIENTRARRRLERWVTRLITWYLLAVFLLIVSNGLATWATGRAEGFISSTIMAAILTTTTINIIGLGLIVLRGHFLSSDKSPKTK